MKQIDKIKELEDEYDKITNRRIDIMKELKVLIQELDDENIELLKKYYDAK